MVEAAAEVANLFTRLCSPHVTVCHCVVQCGVCGTEQHFCLDNAGQCHRAHSTKLAHIINSSARIVSIDTHKRKFKTEIIYKCKFSPRKPTQIGQICPNTDKTASSSCWNPFQESVCHSINSSWVKLAGNNN